MLDAPLRKVAHTVLAMFGTSVTLRRVSGTAYNTATGTMAPTTSDTVVKARLDEYRDRELSDLIHAGDRKVTLAAADLSFLPTIDDLVVIASLEYEVLRVQSELGTDQAVLYILQVRR